MMEHAWTKGTGKCSKEELVISHPIVFLTKAHERVYSCECSPGWAGLACEYDAETVDEEFENCSLDCLNGGQCRKGSKSHTDTAFATHNEDFEFCACPFTYTGLRCQYKFENCGNGEHMCVHGTKCVPPNDKQPSWSCDCGSSKVGEFCQHHRTTVCPGEPTSQDIYRGMLSVAYCVNDGVCTQYENDGMRYVRGIGNSCSCDSS